MADLLESALNLLREAPEGLGYRDFARALMVAHPEVPRTEITDFIGELPKMYGDEVWRPRPGHFAIRTEQDPARASKRRRNVPREAVDRVPKWPVRPLPNRVENLAKLGFREVGHWSRADEVIECQYTEEFDAKRALFAYVVNDNVVYIGRAGREGGDLPAGSGYVSRAIRHALATNKSVRVLAFEPDSDVEHHGLPVNLAAGIEDELIERMQPPWNAYGR